MNLAAAAPAWLYLALVVLLLLAAAEDAWRMRISNMLVAAIVAGAIIAAILAGPALALWQNMALFAGLLAVGVPMFAAGKLGGGDVKLLAATGLWFDFHGGLLMILWTVLAGGLLALIILALRMANWSDRIRKRVAVLRAGSGVPYGVAIAVGGLFATSLS